MATSSTPDAEQLVGALESPALRELAARGRIQQYRKDVVMLQEGDHGDTLYIVLAGRVKVFATGADDREIVFDIHGPGEYVGEMALDGGPRSASVMTLEPTTCSVVTRVTLKDHISKHPEFAFALLDVYGRVRRLFDSLAVEREGARLIPEKLTHQEIADRVGSSREMVSRL